MSHGLRCVTSVFGAFFGLASGFLSVELFDTPGSGSHVACASLVPPKALKEALASKALVYIIKGEENFVVVCSVLFVICQVVRRFPVSARAVLIPTLIVCGGIEFELLYTPCLTRVHL